MKLLKCSIVGILICLHHITNAAGKLHFACAQNYYPPELLQRFQQKTGIEITLNPYDSDGTLATKLNAGRQIYDVIVVNEAYVPTLIKNGSIRKLDKRKLTNLKNIQSEYLSPSFDPKRKYTMPYTAILTSFAYNSARIPDGKLEDSWGAFFHPDKVFWGKIANLDERDDLFIAASWYLGLDECSENPKDAEKVLQLLQKQKPYVVTYSNDRTTARMANEEVFMQQVWNGVAVRVRSKLATTVFVYPKEGVILSRDNFAIPDAAKNVDEAHRFINWMLLPENSAVVSNKYKYTNAIIGADKFIDPDLANDPAFNVPEEFRDRVKPFKICSPKALALRNKVWIKLKMKR
ncbi:extracellular solute-binding protein [Mycoavidus sp. B2-EB]|uniref:extracellular solute-binding protein n=1 Tax=Mycoavidus sp. B2-EB TaxID=2651972 RepID=UPI001626647B|nr:extracellular solute-binding protein [Mycoavidus sp. B2-EB]BBO59824.1 putrescine-binding periplasmic protein [Mycoavidus sp. B2-EB]